MAATVGLAKGGATAARGRGTAAQNRHEINCALRGHDKRCSKQDFQPGLPDPWPAPYLARYK